MSTELRGKVLRTYLWNRHIMKCVSTNWGISILLLKRKKKIPRLKSKPILVGEKTNNSMPCQVPKTLHRKLNNKNSIKQRVNSCALDGLRVPGRSTCDIISCNLTSLIQWEVIPIVIWFLQNGFISVHCIFSQTC